MIGWLFKKLSMDCFRLGKSQYLNTLMRRAKSMDFMQQTEDGKPQERIFTLLFQEDDLTWQNIIYDLVRSEGMDPWDIDVSEIAHKFLEMLKKLKEMDFRISGKVVLASALLLKIKSNRLVEEDINALDSLMSSIDDPEQLLDELPLDGQGGRIKLDHPKLLPRTPQPRKRKVSVYDLIKALEKALEVENRRPPVYVPPKVNLKAFNKAVDVGEMISEMFEKVQSYYVAQADARRHLTFSELVPSDSKEDKVYTFIPLLHLENQRKVDMLQKIHFGEIEIDLAKKKESAGPEQGENPEASVSVASEVKVNDPSEPKPKARKRKQEQPA
jgi:segregation and condensation protein A